MQVSRYKDKLLKTYYAEKEESGLDCSAVNPQCIVILGNAGREFADDNPQTTKYKRESFDLFRNGSKEVQVITYDELFHKIKVLIDLLEGRS